MQQDTRSGVLFALAGFALLSCGDAVIKTMAGEWSPVLVAALRFSLGAAGLSALLLAREGASSFRPTHPRLQALRGLCLALASLFFFSAVFVMPLAEATAVVFVSPILIALLSRPLLKEKAPRGTFIASILALAGVAVVLRPNLIAVGWAALLPLAAACFFSLMVVANRASAGQGSALSMQVFMAMWAAPILAAAALLASAAGLDGFALSWPSWSVVARCVIVAVTASTAHWLVYHGTLRAGASTIAPTTYVQLLVAVVIGWWWFGDAPDALTLLGAGIIIAAGLFLWRMARTRNMPPDPAGD